MTAHRRERQGAILRLEGRRNDETIPDGHGLRRGADGDSRDRARRPARRLSRRLHLGAGDRHGDGQEPLGLRLGHRRSRGDGAFRITPDAARNAVPSDPPIERNSSCA